jgi:hypothetical protein
MPTIPMFYGIIIRMFFVTYRNIMSHIFMPITKGKWLFTRSLTGRFWLATFLRTSTNS